MICMIHMYTVIIPQENLFSYVQRGDLNRLITQLRKHPAAINSAVEVSNGGEKREQ